VVGGQCSHSTSKVQCLRAKLATQRKTLKFFSSHCGQPGSELPPFCHGAHCVVITLTVHEQVAKDDTRQYQSHCVHCLFKVTSVVVEAFVPPGQLRRRLEGMHVTWRAEVHERIKELLDSDTCAIQAIWQNTRLNPVLAKYLSGRPSRNVQVPLPQREHAYLPAFPVAREPIRGCAPSGRCANGTAEIFSIRQPPAEESWNLPEPLPEHADINALMPRWVITVLVRSVHRPSLVSRFHSPASKQWPLGLSAGPPSIHIQ
jgi:hypothetical protein